MSKGESMVERCARAVYERIPNGGYVTRHHGTAVHSNDFRPDAWEDAPDRHEQCRDIARGVFEALMWPTRSMRDAGTAVITHADLKGEFPMSIDVFRAMINAALQPNDEGEGK